MSNHWLLAKGAEWTTPTKHTLYKIYFIFKNEKLVKWLLEGEALPSYKK